MKYLRILLIISVFALPCTAQNWPACDSLVINCCIYNSAGPGTVSISVSNPSSVLFDYPSFALFNSNMDTMALETVSYFGIGTGPQTHVMTVLIPFTLPFTGTLNLYTLFNDTLACSFPITLPDTFAGIDVNNFQETAFTVYPNPVIQPGEIHIINNSFPEGPADFRIINSLGQEVKKYSGNVVKSGSTILNFPNLPGGIYVLQVTQRNRSVYCRFQVLH